jgi:hypothetical protein
MSGYFDTKVGAKSITHTGFGSGTPSSGQVGDIIFSVARVTYVLLDDSDKEKFNKLGGWKGLGTVECQAFINNDNTNVEPIVAKPINANITHWPVVNEIVMVIRTITYEAQTAIKNYKPSYYYTNIVNGWNSVEHNAIPSELFFQTGDEKVTSNFNEKGDVRNLIKAPGDITIEGRTKNSIRFGSTIEGFKTKVVGSDRSPYIILTNNKALSTSPGVPSFEEINKDGSSIYLLNGHKTDFNYSSLNFDSYNTKVENNNNNIVPNQVQEDTPAIPNTKKDEVVIPTQDTPQKTEQVKNTDNSTIQSNQNIDDSNLPDRELAEETSYQETEDYIYDANEQEETVLVKETLSIRKTDTQGRTTVVSVDKNAGASAYDKSPLAQYLRGLGYRNGLLPDNVLRNLRTSDSNSNNLHRLHPVAAAQWERLYQDAISSGIRFNISYLRNAAYRPVSQQKSGYGAASPGFSPHGWGGAVDIQQLYTAQESVYKRLRGLSGKPPYPCGSAEARTVREQNTLYKWLADNGPRYGWYNPYRLADNKGTQDEAWHFEYWGPVK